MLFFVVVVSNYCLVGIDNCYLNVICILLLGFMFKCVCKEEMNYFGNGIYCFGKSYCYMWFFNFFFCCSNLWCFFYVFVIYVFFFFVSFMSDRERDCFVLFFCYFKLILCWVCVYILFSKCKGFIGGILVWLRFC